MKLTHLAVHHTERKADGTLVEPEEQIVDQLGTSRMRVNLSVGGPTFAGGSAPDAATARAVAQINAGGGLLTNARIERQVTAEQAANEATRQCFNCKHWDPNVTKHPFFRRGGTEESYTALARSYMQTAIFDGYAPQEALAEAEAYARINGICGAHQEKTTGEDIFAPMNFTCHKFRPRNYFAQLLMNRKRDEIYKAAQGHKAKLMIVSGGIGGATK